MLEKFLLIDDLIPSIAVRIPTKAVIPIEIIKAVITALNIFPLIEVKEIFIFSAKVNAQNYGLNMN